MKWKRDQHFAVLMEDESMVAVTGYASDDGLWGIHDADKGWRVVHIPSGKHAGSYRLLKEAKQAAELIATVPIDWRRAEPKLTKKVRAYGFHVRNALTRGQEVKPWTS